MNKIEYIFNHHRWHRFGLLFGLLPGLLLPALLFFFPTASAASGEAAARMEEMVVTATRTEKSLESVPGSAAVVTAREIEHRKIFSVDQTLNLLPGVIAGRAGLRDTMSYLTIGGVPGQGRTLILLDGVSLNSPYSGSFDSSGIAVEDVAKIEVVKGPFSSLYGGSAMGGVVNIITRMPDKREALVKTGYGTAWSRGDAQNDLVSLYAAGGDKIGEKLRLFISYDKKQTNGNISNLNIQSKTPTGLTGWSETTSNTGAKRYLIGNRGNDEWTNENIAFKAQYDLSDAAKATLQFLRATHDYENGVPETYLRNAAGVEIWSYGTVKEGTFLKGAGGTARNLYRLGLETEVFQQAAVKLSVAYVDQGKDWYVTPTSATATRTGGAGKLSDTGTATWSADMQATFPLFVNQLATVGGSYKTGWSDSQETSLANWTDEGSATNLTYQAKGKDRNYAFFLQDEIQILEKLTAYLGARQDWWESFDGYVNQTGSVGYPKTYDSRRQSSFSPKAAVVYTPLTKTTLRASLGRSFRSPNLYDLYRTWTSASGTTYLSNPDLTPETAVSWGAGVDQRLWKGARIAVSYFENEISDMIYTRTLSATTKEKINAGRGRSRGVEMEAEQRFEAWLRLFANATWTDSEILENSAAPASVGKEMTDLPRIMFNVGGELHKGPVTASLTGRYMDRRFSNDDNSDIANGVYGAYDQFFTADAKVSYQATPWAALSFSVANLLDREYFSYSPSPGRSWFLELTLRY